LCGAQPSAAGGNILDASDRHERRNFEIGRILHLKSEIANWTSQFDSPISKFRGFGFEMQDSSDLKIFPFECVKDVFASRGEG